jgi:hypothetical protein
MTITGEKQRSLIEDGQVQGSPARSSLLSMLPPNARGTGDPQRPQLGGGAVAMIPKNGSSGISLPQGIMQTLRCLSILGWIVS